tara:strand:+ start:2940 stop:4619 length:1680 start_codon:yes stop_codon:yes gene_type:complete
MSDRCTVFRFILFSALFFTSQVFSNQVSALTRFNLINAESGAVVQSNIAPSQQIVLGDVSAFNVSVQITDLKYDRIHFFTSNGHSQTESVAPYALCGDINGRYLDCSARAGFTSDFTLTAQAYSGNAPVGSAASIRVLVQQPQPTPVADAYFGLVDANTNQVTSTLASGSQLALPDNAKFNVNVRFLNITYDRVRFTTTGGAVREEGVSPYAACGDNNGDYFSCSGVSGFAGNFVLSAQAYSGGSPVGEPATLSVARGASGGGSAQATFGLIDADTDVQLASFFPGSQVVLQQNSAFNFNVQFSGVAYDRVKFNTSNGSSRQEGAAPYAACGDYSGNYLSCTGFSDDFTLTAQAFSGTKPVTMPATITVLVRDSVDDFTGGDLQPPVVTTQSGNQVVSEGSDVVLRISAMGSGILYQWYRDGVSIPGATANALSLNDVDSDDGGSYYCVASNAAGSTRSGTITVNVLAVAGSADVAISWSAPSSRMDGSWLSQTEIDTYRIYYGLTSESGYSNMIEVDGSNTRAVLQDLTFGEYKFALSTVDINRLESSLSELYVLRVQ